MQIKALLRVLVEELGPKFLLERTAPDSGDGVIGVASFAMQDGVETITAIEVLILLVLKKSLNFQGITFRLQLLSGRGCPAELEGGQSILQTQTGWLRQPSYKL